MKTTLFIVAMIIANINSQTIQFIYDVFDAAGTDCISDSDCEDLMEIPSTITNAFWSCVNETVFQSENTTKETSFCQFTQCDTNDPCDTDQICYTINQCDDNNEFYDESYVLYSSICFPNTLCNDIKIDGESNSDMCYTGEDTMTYHSKSEAILCGDSGSGTCIASEQECASVETDCKKDKTCCSKDGWDETGCLALLFTEYVLYSVLTVIFILLFCCVCCCCIYKIRRKGKDYDEMDNQTNHYNVYI